MPQRREGWGGEGEGQLGNLLTEYSRVYLLHGAKILSRHLSTRCNPLTLPHENLTYLTNTLTHPLTYVCTPVKRHKHTPPTHWKPLYNMATVLPWSFDTHPWHVNTLTHAQYQFTPSHPTRHTHLLHPPCESMLFWQFTEFPLRVAWDHATSAIERWYYYCWDHQHWTHKQIAS